MSSKVRSLRKTFDRIRAMHLTALADALRGVPAEMALADAAVARETEKGFELLDGSLRAKVAVDPMIPFPTPAVSGEGPPLRRQDTY